MSFALDGNKRLMGSLKRMKDICPRYLLINPNDYEKEKLSGNSFILHQTADVACLQIVILFTFDSHYIN